MEFKVEQLSKRFGGRVILRSTGIQVTTGEVAGIFGRNGAGKTTLFQCMSGQLKCNIQMTVDGRSVIPRELIKERLLGYVPQHSFLPAHMRLRDIVPLYLEDNSRRDRLYYDPVLAPLMSNRPGELSIGERKYAELLLVGSLGRPLLLLDEPFTMLAPLQIEKAKGFIAQQAAHSAVVMTDHYYLNVTEISNANFVLAEGVLHRAQSIDDLKSYGYLSEPK